MGKRLKNETCENTNRMEKIIEKPFFFENEGAKLFGFIHFPKSESNTIRFNESRGVVFCHPFAEERNISHRITTDFARFLSGEGYHVLRFDYRGCGDSEGEFENATLNTRLSDIGRAIDILQQHMGTNHVTLFGLRLGATLSILYAAVRPQIKSLILWEPIVDVGAYFDQFLRMQVMAENIREGVVRSGRQHLLESLHQGKSVDILGYVLSPKSFNEFARVNVASEIKKFCGPVLIVAIGKRQRKDLQMLAGQGNNKLSQILHIQDRRFWIDPNDALREIRFWRGHDDLFEQAATWLNIIQKN